MKIIRWDELDSTDSLFLLKSLCHEAKGTALTIGGFDGPHRGHLSLFTSVFQQAHEHALVPGIVTFVRSPGSVKKGPQYPGDVSTLTLRLGKFEELGFRFCLLIDFSSDFGKMSGGVFFEILVKTVHMRYLAVGPDFRCGHRLDTGPSEIADLARRDGFRFDSIRQVELDGVRISSSAIRKAVQSADFALAERLLGYPFLLDITTSHWILSVGGIEAPVEDFTQILPPAGRYAADLVSDSGTLEVVMHIASRTVSLGLAGKGSFPPLRSLRSVQFRLS